MRTLKAFMKRDAKQDRRDGIKQTKSEKASDIKEFKAGKTNAQDRKIDLKRKKS